MRTRGGRRLAGNAHTSCVSSSALRHAPPAHSPRASRTHTPVPPCHVCQGNTCFFNSALQLLVSSRMAALVGGGATGATGPLGFAFKQAVLHMQGERVL